MPLLRLTLLIGTCLTLIILPGLRAAPQMEVIGYLPEYRVATIQPSQVKGVTTLIYFGIEPQADGEIPANTIKPETLKKLKSLQKSAQCQLLLCAGGWKRSKNFPVLAANPIAKKKFIQGLVQFCQTHGFNGIDYDWEHPKGKKEMADYQALLRDTAKVFHTNNLKVTIAQASWQNIEKQGYAAVDRVHLMSYDHAYPQATIEKSTADVQRLIQWGCPPNKIALGVPFYGRNQKRDAKAYSQLIQHQAATSDTVDGFAINSPATMRLKVRYARKQQLAGIMIWELGQDSTKAETSLLQAILDQK
ncbi:glycoside hydrolase family 18 protein [Verrucomicrobiaceae bacterium N1E253]|uniref:chitinase n=1 Tax=Oceaniferula marina TaxID=2748318 RepID=A0A851GIK1_9BACT|nr:glycoside hydrolase family 18 protein [Oceaniferula marina]NWK55035.1 glycoside hydrolase family 18 protein [Oceaniferula marina]